MQTKGKNNLIQARSICSDFEVQRLHKMQSETANFVTATLRTGRNMSLMLAHSIHYVKT